VHGPGPPTIVDVQREVLVTSAPATGGARDDLEVDGRHANHARSMVIHRFCSKGEPQNDLEQSFKVT
jgi:hypothetical protein